MNSVEQFGRCARHQPQGIVSGVETQEVHEEHPERVVDTMGLVPAPNLRLWTGRAHRLAVELKEDA